MKKGFFTKFAIVVLAASMLTGCGSLSVEEYKDALDDGMGDYTEAVTELTMSMYDFDKDEAKEARDEAKEAIDEMIKLSAPKAVKDEHKELSECLKVMKEAVDLIYECCEAYDNEDEDKLEKLQEEAEELMEEASDYTGIYYDILEALEDAED